MLLALASCSKPAEERFRFSTDGVSRAPLTPVEEDVLVGNATGALLRLTPEGTVRWRLSLANEIGAGAVVVDQTVVAASVKGEWVGAKAESGEVRWRVNDGPPTLTPLVTDGARVYAIALDGSAHAIDAETGKRVWRSAPPKGWMPSANPAQGPAPTLSEATLHYALEGSGPLSVATDDGRPRWRGDGAQERVVGLEASRDTLFVSRADGSVQALSAATGEARWEARLGREATSPPTLLEGRIWVASAGDMLIALAPSDGVELERVETPGPVRAKVEMGLGWLLIPTAGPQGVLFGMETGRGRDFSVRLDSPLLTGPVATGGRVFVLARDGRVFGFSLRAPVR